MAWLAAVRHPERIERLAILNVPHPLRFLRSLWSPRQLRRSWYIFALQVPGTPGRFIERAIFARFLDDIRRNLPKPGAFTGEVVKRYSEAMACPDALSAACNYYRALFRTDSVRTWAQTRKIEAPVLVIWGERDRYLLPEFAESDRAWVPDLRVERLPHASHWVAEDSPEEVNALLLGFLREAQRAAPAGGRVRF